MWYHQKTGGGPKKATKKPVFAALKLRRYFVKAALKSRVKLLIERRSGRYKMTEAKKEPAQKQKKVRRHTGQAALVVYDFVIFLLVCLIMLILYQNRSAEEVLGPLDLVIHILLAAVPVFTARFIGKVYNQIWRYGGIQCYIRLLVVDACAFAVYILLELFLPLPTHITVSRGFSVYCANLLGALALRMFYRYAYKCGNTRTGFGRFLMGLFNFFARSGSGTSHEVRLSVSNVMILGAGDEGSALAEELISDAESSYIPKFFADTNPDKIGRQIHGLKIYDAKAVTDIMLREYEISDIIFADPGLDEETAKTLYTKYRDWGFKVRTFDHNQLRTEVSERGKLRSMGLDDLLFRKPKSILDSKTASFYKGKRVLVTGGGGSIGAELCRILAKMKPAMIVIADIYENGAYDVKQELKIIYGDELDVRIEIVSVTNKPGLLKIFEKYRPEVVLNAAAHKHVPLMENNCVEAAYNNVFGTLNTVQCAVETGAERFIMLSTDKAVNPTNVMGATKRLCEMIIAAYAAEEGNKVNFSATRFGNVLGSAGSVVPLFKKQIAYGGPVTVTDKRIIRYFMSISEAASLVLISGAMAASGELFVLDMGEPVKILELAETMIRISGLRPYVDIDIVETGLRPGEKLYEELLLRTENLDKTPNEMIFIERDRPHSLKDVEAKLEILKKAVDTGDDARVREALMEIVPEFKDPEDVNCNVGMPEDDENS